MTAPDRAACRELLRATEALARAVCNEDHEALVAALEEREVRFGAARDALGDSPDAEVRGLLQRLEVLDRRILASARLAQRDVCGELESIGRARGAARALQRQAPTEGPRFFTRRV